MPDFAALDRYLHRRYRPGERILTVAAKRLLPLATLARNPPDCRPVDIVLLHPHPAAARRHQRLAAALRERGMSVAEETVPGVARILRERRLYLAHDAAAATPREWRLQAGYAGWLAARHRARVLVTFMDDSLHSPFLREAFAAHGGKLANVSHAIAWPTMDFSMCDADWLLLWGERSLRSLQAAPVRHGRCRTILVGSIYLRDEEHDASRRRADRVLWIGQDLSSVHGESLRADVLAFADHARDHLRDVVIRPHPRDRGALRALVAPLLPHAAWADPGTPLASALADVRIAASSFSSGLVEAAARGVPVIALSTSGLAQAIGLGDHGLPVVRDAEGFAAGMASILADYDRACAAARSLAAEHLHGLGDATARCSGVLEALVRGIDPETLGLPTSHLEPCE